ncbi:hypothetical protein Hanom_Chr10g00950851 [Helianthus anomalus]
MYLFRLNILIIDPNRNYKKYGGCMAVITNGTHQIQLTSSQYRLQLLQLWI